jgi:hypothetical protein
MAGCDVVISDSLTARLVKTTSATPVVRGVFIRGSFARAIYCFLPEITATPKKY